MGPDLGDAADGDGEPSVIAPVSVRSPQEARVSVHWLSECSDPRVEETLNSWILGILTGSKLVTRAIVTKHQMSEPRGESTYQIRDIKESKNCLLVPSGTWLPKSRFSSRGSSPCTGASST